MGKYRYIFFDLDGTLTDSGEGIMRSVQYALHRSGIEQADYRELRSFVGPPLTDSFRTHFGMSEEEAVRALAYYRERYTEKGIYENSVYDGITDMLRDLCADGKILAVASSKPEPFVRRVLDYFELSEYFSVTVGSSLSLKGARKEEILTELMRRFALKEGEKSEILMIGDRRYDVRGAKAVGIDSVGVYYGYADAGELEEAGADYIVNTVAELHTLLKAF